MFRRNLSAKILLGVGLTVAVVIAIYTYFVIRVQEAWWQERTEAQNLIAATLVNEYLNGVMLSDRHLEMQGFLRHMQDAGDILRGRIIRPDGGVVFSTETQEVERAVFDAPPELFRQEGALQGVRQAGGTRVAVVMRPVVNVASCQRCHHSDQPYLGAIILERSLAPAAASVASSRNLLIVYGLIIFVLVGLVLWLLILRLISQPVDNLLQQMRRVQAGDLGARAASESQDEIGQLAGGFNEMVGSLDAATSELRASHAKQIQQASKLATIGELAAGIAHEIRNPLAGIGAAVEVLAEGGAPAGADREVVGEIRRQIARLNHTLRDLLDFARLREPEIALCDLGGIVRPMLVLVRPDAQKHQVRIVEEFAPDLPPINGDARQLQQAVLNILLNAVQAMAGGGTLTVRAAPGPVATPAGVELAITDTGEGIPAENLEKIFSPFFTTKHRGTGLGLAITRAIVEKHGGAIHVESTVGRGTTFRLTFAAASLPPAAAEETTTHGTNQDPGH